MIKGMIMWTRDFGVVSETSLLWWSFESRHVDESRSGTNPSDRSRRCRQESISMWGVYWPLIPSCICSSMSFGPCLFMEFIRLPGVLHRWLTRAATYISPELRLTDQFHNGLPTVTFGLVVVHEIALSLKRFSQRLRQTLACDASQSTAAVA